MKNDDKPKRWFDWLPYITPIAQTFIALCAVAGLFFAIRQNSRTVEIVKRAGDAFLAMSYPIVKFSNYTWIFDDKKGLIGCVNPAHSITVSYQNFSNVPVAIEKTTLKIAVGDRAIDISPEFSVGGLGEYILPANRRSGISAGAPEELTTIYKRLQGRTSPPYFNFTLTILYRSLITEKRYQYTEKL